MGQHVLSTDIINWVKKNTNPSATIVNINKLKGSTSSTLHCVTLKQGEAIKDVVVRQFDNQEWVQEEPDLAIHEAYSLHKASDSIVPTPELIAFDEMGTECGVPAVLMSYLDGDVHLLPNDQSKWLYGLAKALSEIHQMNRTEFPYTYFSYQDSATLKVPVWSNVPNAWRKAIDYIQDDPPVYTPQFIHRDYHPANVLWEEEKVSGVVDWVNACIGPLAVDVGHCRVNLAQLYSVETADAFLDCYRALNHHFVYDPYWDIVSLVDILSGEPEVYPGWRAFGVTDLTNHMMKERLDRYVLSLVARI